MLLGLSTVNLAAEQGGDWTEFASREDRFTCNFPGTPAVSTTTWTSEYGAVLPARLYSATQGQSRYSMMVVDYREIERILTEKSNACPAGAETCRGGGATGLGYWKVDLQGALVYATWKLMSRPGVQPIGVTREYIKAGDKIKVRCHTLRYGSRGCLLGFLKAADGSVKDWDGGNAPAPTDF